MSNTLDESIFPLKVVMEDGEPLENVPSNPLRDKWEKEGYTKDCYGGNCNYILGYYEDGRPIPNYSCVLCLSKNCYLSNGWVVPEEDKEAYEKWEKAVDDFYKLHSPDFYDKYMKNSEDSDE